MDNPYWRNGFAPAGVGGEGEGVGAPLHAQGGSAGKRLAQQIGAIAILGPEVVFDGASGVRHRGFF